MAYILLADDDPGAIRFAAAYLTKCGHRAEVVTDGAQAMERLRAERPDILVTDVMMPWRDGYEVIHELCQRYPEGTPAVILLTTIGADGLPLSGMSGPVQANILRHRNAPALGWQITLTVEPILYGSYDNYPALPDGLGLRAYGAPVDDYRPWETDS